MDWIQQWQSKLNKQNGVAPLVRTGGSRHTGLAALPYRNIHKLWDTPTTERFFLLYNRMLDGDEASSHLDMFSLEMFENIAYIMAKHADPSIPDSPERRKYKTTSMPQARTEKMNCLRDSPKNILSV